MSDVGYEPVSSMASHCQFCFYYDATICFNPIVQEDPKVPTNAKGQKEVSPTGWCEEFASMVEDWKLVKKIGSIQFLLEPADADAVLNIPVDKADLSPKGREDKPHITVLWGVLPDVTAEEISKITEGIGDVEVVLKDLELFPENELGVPWVIRWESGKLVKLHEELSRLAHIQVHADFLPHISVAYLRPDRVDSYRKRANPLKGQVLTLRKLVYSGDVVMDLKKKKITAVVGKPKGKTATAVQNVIFSPRKEWGIEEAQKWLKRHDLKSGEIEVAIKSYRFRQRDPADFQERSFRTVPFKSSQVKKSNDFFPVHLLLKVTDPGEYNEKNEATMRERAREMASYAESGRYYDPKGDYLCTDCNQFVEGLCVSVGDPDDEEISGTTGSCRYWEAIIGERRPVPLEKKFSKVAAGYTERPHVKGFGCKRCEYGEKAIKRDSDGRLIWCAFWGMHAIPNACCGENEGKDDVYPGTKKVAGTEELSKPYASASDAPSYVPKSKRKQWIAVWNSAYNRALKDGKSAKDAESSAFAQANAVAGPNSEKVFAAILQKARDDEAEDFTNAVIAAIQKEFESLPIETQTPLETSMVSGVIQGMMQIDISNAALLRSSNELAHDYAVERAAEMVGMKRDVEGNLVTNPNAKWAISQTTRDKIRDIVAQSFTQDSSMSEIKQRIYEALQDEAASNGIFSEGRAEMIARTEVSHAQTGGNYTVWRESGLVHRVKWLVSNDPDVCPICLGNDKKEVDLGKKFPSGVERPPQHPWCRCVLVASKVHAT